MNKEVLKIYFFHFIAAIISVIIFLWVISQYLNTYTKHNQYIQTPNVLKLPLHKAIEIIQSKKLKYKIIDSIYQPEEKPGVVIAQNPAPNTNVKENRSIYITITSFQPPLVQMPKLVDLSERQAIMLIESYGLKLGKIIYEPSYCNGCVIKQLYQNSEIPSGKYIRKGSRISIVVGQKGNNFTTSSDTIKTEEPSFDRE